jgi:2,3,4,5-tetrahydropyridine-2-carboxylate N-succinyltransferase
MRAPSGSAKRCAKALPILAVNHSEDPTLSTLQSVIESAWERRSELGPTRAELELREAVEECLAALDSGELRVAEQRDGHWVVNQWLKQAVLLSFRINDNQVVDAGYTRFFDKVPLKFARHDAAAFKQSGARAVPGSIVRRGAYIASDVVLMPSFVNIGAYVDQGTMVDTWVTVGSCAQIGKRVHLSGGVGIGGVLEPLQAAPTIIEDDCFVGARSEVVEGVVVERGSVLGMGVYIGQSTKIYDRETGEIHYGRVPAGSVVVAGNLPSKDGTHSLYCAVIVKKVDEKPRSKTSLNDLLRTAD